MNQLKISIITCTYNSQTYLRECIASVEKQSDQNYEHIFIDAYSTDHTKKIIKAYQKRRPAKVKFFSRKRNGISDAMNYGVNQSTGDIICHLHSDDMLYSSDTLNQVKLLFNSHSSTEAVIGDCQFIKDGLQFSVFPTENLKKRLFFLFPIIYLFSSNRIPHPSVFLSKNVFLKHGGFSPKLQTTMDYDMWFRILPKIKVTYTLNLLSLYRVHNQTTSNKNSALVKKEIELVRKKYANEYPTSYFVSKLSKYINILR